MDTTASFVRGLVILLVGLALLGWMLYRWLRTSRDDPGRLILKWVLTGLIIVFLLAPLGAALTTSGPGGAFLVPFVAVGGLLLALLWTPNLVDWVGRRFESLYTGGTTPPDPEPFYSKAQGLRKRGQFTEAAAEVLAQLERFPGDLTGHLLLAEIQVRDLGDMAAAHGTLQSFCDQPGHPDQNIWLALNTLADWHLQFAQDVDSARRCLEEILARLPDTPQAALAAQRLGHLGTQESLAASRKRDPIVLQPGASNIGLMKDSSHLRRPEKDPEEDLAETILHLESHPQDTEAREHLAKLYARHYRDLDLAARELNWLVSQAQQPDKNKVRWLNLLADFQVSLQGDYDGARGTLERIIELNPVAAAAEVARHRLDHLRLEIKGLNQGRTIPFQPGSARTNPASDPSAPRGSAGPTPEDLDQEDRGG